MLARMDPRVVVHVLRGSEVLGELGEPFLVEIAALAVTVRHPAGATVFRQNDPPDALYVVSTGLVRVVSTSPEGVQVTMNTLGPGAAFGELALLDGRPRSASALAAADSVLLRIPRVPFVAMVRARPDLAMALIRGLTTRVRALTHAVHDSVSVTGRVRLARHLLRLADQRGVGVDGVVELREHLPQAVLASSVGLGRQATNRLLGELQEEGVIRVHRARIVVIDRARLAGLAET